MMISFPHTIRTIQPSQAYTVTVNARVEEDGFTELGFEIPLGISEQAFSRLALQYYHLVDTAQEAARERRGEVLRDRLEAGIAGTEPREEAS
jgi:hypothetical protein